MPAVSSDGNIEAWRKCTLIFIERAFCFQMPGTEKWSQKLEQIL